MRSVCFLNKFEFEFGGSILQNAIRMGDIDNDGENEVVIGNVNGDLVVLKGNKIWQTITGLEMITSVAVGDIMNCGSNAVVVTSGNGWCYIYLCLHSTQPQGGAKLQLVHSQRIPANTKVLVLGDVQGDGQIDMVLGLTDRVVRIYRWLQSATNANLVCLNKCECANQIGTICLGRRPDGTPCILVSQPGATYMTITHKSSETEESGMSVEYHGITASKSYGSNICAEIIGNIKRDDTLAFSSLDGSVNLIKDHQLLWSLSLEQQIFGLGKVKVCKDGTDQLVAGCWNGHTYIIDLQGNIVCFELGQAIQGFACGPYTHNNNPAFIYVTFSNKIFIYYDLKVDYLECRSIYSIQKRDPRFAHMSQAQLRDLTKFLMYTFVPPAKHPQNDPSSEQKLSKQ